MITKASELISTLKEDRSLCLSWTCGTRPSAPGSYSIKGVRVYAAAVKGAEKLNALKCIRNDYQYRAYKLTLQCRLEA